MRAAILIAFVFHLASARAGLPPDLLWPCAGPTVDILTSDANWIGHTGDVNYQVQFSFSNTFMILEYDGYTPLPWQDLSMLWFDAFYFWRVRAFDGTVWSSWSYTCDFITATIPPPPAPTLILPACGTTGAGSTQAFFWNYAIGAINWELQLATNAAFVPATSYFTTLQNQVVNGLLPGTTYYWRVRGQSLGGWGQWSTSCILFTGSGPTPLALRLFLQGPLDPVTLLMGDQLRALAWLPANEPYSALGFVGIANAGVAIAPSLLTTTGSNAPVDWILVEGRHATTNAILAQWAMLVQRDGDVMMPDGSTPVPSFPVGQVKISVRHRNHLGIMGATAQNANGTTITLDLTLTGTAVYGTDPTATVSGRRALWSGDASGDGVLKYTGTVNDRDMILTRIGGTVPTATVNGYFREDVNLDGVVKYTGSANDRDPILQNIGGTVPTATRTAQLP